MLLSFNVLLQMANDEFFLIVFFSPIAHKDNKCAFDGYMYVRLLSCAPFVFFFFHVLLAVSSWIQIGIHSNSSLPIPKRLLRE